LDDQINELKRYSEQHRNQLEETEKNKKMLESELRSYQEKLDRETLERRKIENEAQQAKKESEELAKKQEEINHRLHLLTGGLGWDVYNRVHQMKQKEEDKLVDQECTICMENVPNVTFYPCEHKCICGECLPRMKKQICPICNTPIEKTEEE